MKTTYRHFTVTTDHGQITVKFPDKPSEAVRTSLRANKFRWSGTGQYWYRLGGAYADFISALERMMDREAGTRTPPDGKCWKCDAPGWMRRYGAATPVHCDKCHSEHMEKQLTPYVDVDSLYEDQCRSACGL